MGEKIILNLDESGNLGSGGRYFTIACVATTNTKPLRTVMKKSILKVKNKFPEFKDHKELKSSDCYAVIKDYMLRKIASKDNIEVRYIVSDKTHVKKQLLDDENLLYNYMLKFLIVPIARQRNCSELEINLDKRSIKVNSINSFEDYIKIHLNFELNLDVKVTVKYVESHNSYAIQAADFVANAVNTKYEYEHCHCYELIAHKIAQSEKFPRSRFGKQKVVNI